MKIIPENTAISTGVALSATELVSMIPVGSTVLDYGAGRLRNAYFLQEKGYIVSIMETPLQLSRLQEKGIERFQSVYTTQETISEVFDAIICSFVLNVIPDRLIRSEILSHIEQILAEEGTLFLEVRKPRGVLATKYHECYEDGFVIGKGISKTFQKPYTKDEIELFISQHGFIVEKTLSTSDSWCVRAKKGVTFC